MAFKVNQIVRHRDGSLRHRCTLRYQVLALPPRGRDDLKGFIKVVWMDDPDGGLVAWQSAKHFEPFPQS